jgi:hypothetical protein
MNRQAPVRVTNCQPFKVAGLRLGATLGSQTGCPGADLAGAAVCGLVGKQVDDLVQPAVQNWANNSNDLVSRSIRSVVDFTGCASA